MKKSSTTRKVPLSMTHRASGPGFAALAPRLGVDESGAAGAAMFDDVMMSSSVR
jgi:hypothetical protein